MRVIITGGTGLIGRALAQDLTEAGHEVFLLSRNPATAEPTSDSARIEGWDAATGEKWSRLIKDDTAIVNLAGAAIADKRWSPERKQEIVDSRVKAGEAVLDAISQATHKPKVVIQSSAVGYYGPSDDSLITEESPAGEDFLADVCVQWENSIAPLHDDPGIRVAIIRTGVVLSLDGGAFPRQLQPFKFYAGGPVGSGQQWFPWIHVKDEVGAIRYILESEDASGVFNLSAPNPVTNLRFTHHLSRTIRKPGLIPAPGFAMQLLFGEMSTVLLDGQRVIPQRLQEAGYEFQFEEVQDALQDLVGKK